MQGQEVYKYISEDAARALENIVGSEYFSTDPVVCSAYIGRGFDKQALTFNGISRAPAAAILPLTTQEVAKIIKTCNRYNIPYCPMSTYGMAFGGPNFRDDMLFIDLKRMDNMELDEKNMFVVLESGVTFCQMHGETLKRGLLGCVPGGGGGSSPLANALVNGMGLFNYRITYAAQRRWNGMEWVSPEGEIYRFGSLAEGEDSWYWGDAIGPNVSGLIHGMTGWGGGMGIVTRMAIKLYPFQPKKLEPQGISYDACVKMPEDRVKWAVASFKTEEDCEKAVQEIGKARICLIVNRVPAYWRDIARTRGDVAYRNKFWESWSKRTREDVKSSIVLRVCLLGRASAKHLEYEENVFNDIVAENGGKLGRARQVDEASFYAANSLGMWQPTGMFGECDAGMEALACNKAARRQWMKRETEPEYLEHFLDPKGDSPWYMSYNMGRLYYSELHGLPDAGEMDPEDKFAGVPGLPAHFMRWRISEAGKVLLNTGLYSFFYSLVTPVKLFSSCFHNYTDWLDRFKAEFDPKGLSAPGHPYIIDKMLDEKFPDSVTQELKDKIAEVTAGPWKGNPD
jgi:FAD binding domain-containing protein